MITIPEVYTKLFDEEYLINFNIIPGGLDNDRPEIIFLRIRVKNFQIGEC